jgi:nucleoside-diphosphate-sugar epimerase
LNDEKVDMTKGEQERDFIYIEDAVESYSAIIRHAETFIGFIEMDIGSGTTVQIKDLASRIKRMTDSKSIINFGAIPYRKNEPMYACANISLLKRTGWNSKYEIEDGLRETIDYYKKEMIK